jgi:hypothetical protein
MLLLANGREGGPTDENGLCRGWNMPANPLVNLCRTRH